MCRHLFVFFFSEKQIHWLVYHPHGRFSQTWSLTTWLMIVKIYMQLHKCMNKSTRNSYNNKVSNSLHKITNLDPDILEVKRISQLWEKKLTNMGISKVAAPIRECRLDFLEPSSIDDMDNLWRARITIHI